LFAHVAILDLNAFVGCFMRISYIWLADIFSHFYMLCTSICWVCLYGIYSLW